MDFSLLQDERCIPPLVQGIKVQSDPFICISQVVCLAIISQNHPSFPSELVAPLNSKPRPWQRWGGVDPEAAIQPHWVPQSVLYWNCFSGRAQDYCRNRREYKFTNLAEKITELISGRDVWHHQLPLSSLEAVGARMIPEMASSLLVPRLEVENQSACK